MTSPNIRYRIMPCEEDTYWTILQYLNGIRGQEAMPPKVLENRDIVYFVGEGILRISREEKVVSFLHGFKDEVTDAEKEITKELERRFGIN